VEPYVSRVNNLKKLASFALDQGESIKKALIEQYKQENPSIQPSLNASNIPPSRLYAEPTAPQQLDISATPNQFKSNSTPFVPKQAINMSQRPPINQFSQTNGSTTLIGSAQNTNGLVRVLLNRRIVDEFLSMGTAHLQNNLEFCGILSGQLLPYDLNSTEKEKYFIVSHCFIPKQTCTENSCKALNEITVFNRQDKLGLITLGWIHIHPTQDAFLSSVDLRTQFGYQCSLPEAFAIVCAPRANPDIGVFRIMDKRIGKLDGMEKIKDKFRENIEWGNQHEYVSETYFETCPHVLMSYDLNIPYEVVDLR